MATRLQIPQEDRLKIIQDRINQYNIRFPVAEISDKLKADQGNVSSMLSGKKPISDNFYTSFCDAYPARYINIDNHSQVNEDPIEYKKPDYIEEAFKLLKEQNEYLRKLIDSSLVVLSSDVNNNAAAIRAEIRGYAQRQILKEVNGNDDEFLKAKAEADKIYLLNLKQLLGDNKPGAGN